MLSFYFLLGVTLTAVRASPSTEWLLTAHTGYPFLLTGPGRQCPGLLLTEVNWIAFELLPDSLYSLSPSLVRDTHTDTVGYVP